MIKSYLCEEYLSFTLLKVYGLKKSVVLQIAEDHVMGG